MNLRGVGQVRKIHIVSLQPLGWGGKHQLCNGFSHSLYFKKIQGLKPEYGSYFAPSLKAGVIKTNELTR